MGPQAAVFVATNSAQAQPQVPPLFRALDRRRESLTRAAGPEAAEPLDRS